MAISKCTSKHLSASGLVHTGKALLVGARVFAGSGAAATFTVYDNTAGSGTVVLTLKALANNTQEFSPMATLPVGTGIYATLAGAGAQGTILYEGL